MGASRSSPSEKETITAHNNAAELSQIPEFLPSVMILLIKRVYSGFLTHSDEASLAALIASLAVATETGRCTETLTQRLKPSHSEMKSIKKN